MALITLILPNNVVQFAVAKSDIGNPTGNWKVKAATYDIENNAFADDGGDWEATNNPEPAAADGDYTTATTIPEFSTLAIPVAGVVVLFGLAQRRRRAARG